MSKRSVGTHDGGFHADEVTACALLLLFDQIDRDKIIRTRDPVLLEQCEYVCDVGGVYDPLARRFDHHQAEYSGTLSSAGMIWLYFKQQGLVDDALYEFVNRALIRGVDAHDNGLIQGDPGMTTFSQVISNFLPIEHDVPEEEMMQAFLTAVDFAEGHLRRLKQRRAYTVRCRAEVQQEMSRGSYVMTFSEMIPWMDNFFELGGARHPARFVVMPAGPNWKLRGIPPTADRRMEVRTPLPAAWAGLRDEELARVSGIPGAIFCHKGRFISIWATKEGAMHALQIALNLSQ